MDRTAYNWSVRLGYSPLTGTMDVPGPDPLPAEFLLSDYATGGPPYRVRVTADDPIYRFPPTRFTDTELPAEPAMVVGRRVAFVAVGRASESGVR
jgi:hypothetical protein